MLKFGLYEKYKNLKKSSSWFGRLLNKFTNHEEDISNFVCLTSQKVRTLPEIIKEVLAISLRENKQAEPHLLMLNY